MSALPSLDGAVLLTHWGVLRAHGNDAAAFLHGQLTSDFSTLDATHARLAGYCSAKGRLLASFIGWKAADDEILLACRADLLPATLKRLSMFVLRAQCRLNDASDELRVWGLAGPSALAWLGPAAPTAAWDAARSGHATLIKLPDALGVPRFLWVAASQSPPLPAIDLSAWRSGEVHSGIASIEAATVDQFVPQMINFELIGAVDFKKGCYPGQEVVARSQYRGGVKRRMFLFTTAAATAAGVEIFHSAEPGQPAGKVVNAAPLPGGASVVLGEVKLAAMAAGSLHLGAADGALLQPSGLPYEVPYVTD